MLCEVETKPRSWECHRILGGLRDHVMIFALRRPQPSVSRDATTRQITRKFYTPAGNSSPGGGFGFVNRLNTRLKKTIFCQGGALLIRIRLHKRREFGSEGRRDVCHNPTAPSGLHQTTYAHATDTCSRHLYTVQLQQAMTHQANLEKKIGSSNHSSKLFQNTTPKPNTRRHRHRTT